MINDTSMNRIINRRSFIQLVAMAGTAAVCWQTGLFKKASLQVARRSQPIMGTVINLVVYGPDKDGCEEALQRTIATMQGLEAKLSRHMPGSELFQLNRAGVLENPGTDLQRVLAMAAELHSSTAGSFDVTILPLLRLYEEKQAAGELSPDSDYGLAHGLVDYDQVRVSEAEISYGRPNMAISLDGIGKGYIVDRGVETLKAYGFNNVYVEAGGDMMVSGLKNGTSPWRIGVRNPRPELSDKLVAFSVSDKAVATSGDYLQSFTADRKHHHIIDPRSGFSPPELASVTITAPDVAQADGLATAVMVLGPSDGIDLIESLDGCEAYLVGKDLQDYNTTGFFS